NLCQMAMSTAPSEIIVEKEGSKRVLTLNRPKALNALNLSMVREIYPRFREWEDAGDVDLIILKGSGEKAFCAGGDVLAVIRSAKEAAEGGTCTVHKDFFREEYRLNHLIGNLSKTFVALIDGIVMGGGCGLSVNGRYRVATERTMLAMPETALGLFPDVGGSYFLSRLKNNLGLFLALTGYRLNGADTLHAGLATHYVPSAKLADLQRKLLTLKTVTDKSVDAAIREFEPTDIPGSVEEILANLKKENSEWAQKQLKTLSKMSPTSMKVTFKQLEHGAKMSFGEAISAFKVFTMEYRLTQRSLKDHDFYEGCRAILIDKDRNPKWKPATLEEVPDAHIERYFAPLGREDIFLDGPTAKI
ncbi:enoyl-CoA hydratase/isomerase family protein, partial [Teladorsagia circumcincta]